MITLDNLTRINNDVNGNPRYVLHFLGLITDAESRAIYSDYATSVRIVKHYELALKKSRALGGRKYHTKSYGGGIVFQSYNTTTLVEKLNELNNL